MEINARSNPPNFSPISSKDGQYGTSSSFWPLFTARYPVSPANQILTLGPVCKFGVVFASTAQEAQRDLQWSCIPLPVVCCAGVHVKLNTPVIFSSDEELHGRATVIVRESHQSRQCVLLFGMPFDSKYGSFPRGANMWGF